METEDATVEEKIAAMWETLGDAGRHWVVSMSEDLGELSWVDEAIARAERAEKCLLRAAQIRARGDA